MHRLPSWLTAGLALALAACGSDPASKPSLDPTWLGLEAKPPGTADAIVGGPGAAAHAERVRAYADQGLGSEVGRSEVAENGSFQPIDIGDNLHEAIWLVAEGAGGRSPALRLVNDVVGPAIEFGAIDLARGGRDATLSFSCGEACRFECGLDGDAPSPCVSPAAFSNLGAGAHTFVVAAVDEAGNAASIEHRWTAGGGARVVLQEVPRDPNNSRDAVFAFGCGRDACDFTCQLDDGTPAACTSPVELSALDDGAHTFTVQGVDQGGEAAEPAVHEWTVDLRPPVVFIDVAPPAISNRQDFRFSCDESSCSFDCSYDGGAWDRCDISPSLADGPHELSVRAVDLAGNVSEPVGWSWVLDRLRPVVSFEEVPSSPTREAVGVFRFACDEDCTFTCSVDGGPATSCTSPFATDPLLAGEHSLRVSAVDVAGSVSDPLRHSWTVEVTAWTAASLGGGHGCGIADDGGLWCWGANRGGEVGDGTTEPRPLPVRIGEATWTAVATGEGHGCGIQADGSLWCWGRNDRGQLGAGDTLPRLAPERVGTESDWAAIASRGLHTCGLRTNQILSCWGANDDGQLGDGTEEDRLLPTEIGNDFVQVAPADRHSCALKNDGTLWCWGSNADTALGTGGGNSAEPVGVDLATDWRAVAVGAGHTCGLKLDGSLWCWGRNQEGQSGSESTNWQSRPAKVGDASTWLAVAAGDRHTCAVQSDASLWCWGTSDAGQLAAARSELLREPTRMGGDGWLLPLAGRRTTCGLRTDGALVCWGANDGGLLARGAVAEKLQPQPLGLQGVTALSTWYDHACALGAEGAGSCWGENGTAQVAATDDFAYTSPEALPGTWLELGAGDGHTCGIKTDGTLWCWGRNDYGQLGVGNRDPQSGLAQVGAEADWSDLKVGANHTCASRGAAGVFCWGWNGYKQLGKQGSGNDFTPSAFGVGRTWLAVDPGSYTTLAIRDDGTLWSTEPCAFAECDLLQAAVESGWTQVSAGDRHVCGIRAGELRCWGDEGDGRLGGEFSGPVHHAHSDWIDVSAGIARTCGIRQGGTLWCWGDGDMGGIGDGGREDRLTPVQIGAERSWSQVSVGRDHTCAISEETAYCWGWNDRGQLGDGAGPSATPAAVERS